ncbi:MAG: hypothetical protein R3C05_05735 [Pirellulaceae bacterium]
MSGRDTDQVLQEVEAFTSTLDPEKAAPDRDQAQALLESLWVYEEHRAPNIELVGKTFQADEPRIPPPLFGPLAIGRNTESTVNRRPITYPVGKTC